MENFPMLPDLESPWGAVQQPNPRLDCFFIQAPLTLALARARGLASAGAETEAGAAGGEYADPAAEECVAVTAQLRAELDALADETRDLPVPMYQNIIDPNLNTALTDKYPGTLSM